MIHLNAFSYYSLLRSPASIEALVLKAKENGMNSIVIADYTGMYGLIEFIKIASENNVKPILGTYLFDPNDEKINCVILAKNNYGYRRVCELITSFQLNDDFNLINELKIDLENIIILSDSIDLIKSLPRNENIFVKIFFTKKRKRICRELFNFAEQNKISIVAVNPIFFIEKDDYLLHKVLNAIRLNTTLEQIDPGELADEEEYFKTPAEMNKIWKAYSEALNNTLKIANSCNVDLRLGEYKHPKFPLPRNETSFSYLWKIAFNGLSKKYQPITEQAVNRLQEELKVIKELGFADYFLIVWDIVRQAKLLGMMSLGRGSAANSLVAYCLDLTQIDPLKYNLYFERFLNLGRASPPDIDLDFSWKERDTIIKYLFQKYGYDRVAMISTINTFRARSAFREVAKVFGISESEIAEYTQFIPWTSAENLPFLTKKFPETKLLDLDNEPWRTIIEIARRLANLPRHLSIHPGGIVIAPEPLTNFTALEYAENKGLGLIITQPDMYSIEELGLVKIDILSQRSLSVVKETMDKIAENKNRKEGSELKIFRLE